MPSTHLVTTDSAAPALEVSDLIVNLLAEARFEIGRDPLAADQCLDRCQALLSQTRSTTAMDERPAVRVGGLAPWQAARIERHVDANLSARLSTAELATLVRLSENHFARAFKASIGCPPHAYVVQRRILHAKTLMLHTDTPLSQVALDCGLADQAHLSRLFRRHSGSTPSAWRRQHRSPEQLPPDCRGSSSARDTMRL